MKLHLNRTRLNTIFGIGSPFLDFALLALAFFLSLEAFNAYFPKSGINYTATHLRRLADAILFASPVLLTKRKWIVSIYLIIPVLYILSNLWYYRNYSTLMPLSSYTMFENLNGLGPSICRSIKQYDLLIILPILIFLIYYWWRKSNHKRTLYNRLIPLSLGFLFIEAVLLPSYFVGAEKPSKYIEMYQFDSIRGYRQFGFINYWVYQIALNRKVTEKEKLLVEEFFKDYYQKTAKIRNIVEPSDKNLILILAESLQSWPIGLVVEGDTVTPNINRIIKNDSTLYFPNILPQVKDGRSSDAQLILNTGLLPLNSGAASSLFGTNKYPSIASYLKERGYHTSSTICEGGAFWNQNTTTFNYCFDILNDNTTYGADAPKQDEVLFKKAFQHISKMGEPFYAQIVTISGHDPMSFDRNKRLQNAKSIKDKTVRYNLAITQFVDSCIGAFIKDIKESGLYQNSIIVITGDHDQITKNMFENRPIIELTDRFVPLIIINSPLPTKSNSIAGQIDIFPTLLDIMGVGEHPYRGLGHSLLRLHPEGAVYHDGSSIGNVSADSLQILKDRWELSDLIIRLNSEYQNLFPVN